jgi:hypothetical protein
MNMVLVSDKEMMEVDAGWIDRAYDYEGYGSITHTADLKPAASLAVHVAVGAATGGIKGAVGGAMLWSVRSW